MYTQLELIEGEALKLTVSERALLAQRLQRIATVERGEVQDIPMGDAIAKLRAGLK
jgi:hypothetical protein